MRRAVFLALGVLELAVAGILLAVGLLLPASADVRQNFDRAERATASARRQVVSVREQVQTVRDPRVQRFLRDLEPHLPGLKRRLQGDLNFATVGEAAQSLGSLADAMEGWAQSLDPALVRNLSDGAARLASFLDDGVAAGAARSA